MMTLMRRHRPAMLAASCAGVLALMGVAPIAAVQSVNPIPTISSNGQESLDSRVNLKVKDVPLAAALQRLVRNGVPLLYSTDLVRNAGPVSCDCVGLTLAKALGQLFQGRGIIYRELESGEIVLRPAPRRRTSASEPVRVGAIVGRVTDARSGAGISGASVTVGGTRFSAITGNTGAFRVAGVPVGTYEVVVQQIGYAEAKQSVTVGAGAEARVDFALEVSALPLDELVVTGTAFATRVRTLPNPISVITAKEIEAKGATDITDLLRGEIPGVMSLTGGASEFVSYIYVRGNGSSAGALSGQDLIKVYIDGIAVAHGRFLSTIDPNSIERIEVIRGPQASAIYGSEAASGVLQIFTKKGTPGLARPRLTFQASAGVIESDYSPSDGGTPLTQDHSLEVSGGGNSFSYRAGASYNTAGEWVKNHRSESLGLSGGLRVVQGPLTAELSALWSERELGLSNSTVYLRYPASACSRCGPDAVDNRERNQSQRTMGLTLRYQATPQWQHALTLGSDDNYWAWHQPEPTYNAPSDTFVVLSNEEHRRRSVRYYTAYDAELGGEMTARFTGGVDYWSYKLNGSNARNLLDALGTVRMSPSSSITLSNDGWWNAGYFGMAELGFQDRFYVTLTGRVEDNPNFGAEYGRAFSPRVGGSYVQALGTAELKMRAQWGKGIRPPPPVAHTGSLSSSSITLPNPEIGPQEKVGWDAGLDLYWGRRASFSLTRFDEDTKNLIYLETIDATSIPRLYQYRNIGLVGIEGWEVEGEVALGPVTLSANYTYSDAVVKEVDAATAANPNATLQVGDRTPNSPKHTGGGRVTARVGGGRVSLDASVIAGGRSLDWVSAYDWIYGGDPFRGSIRAYYTEYPALWKWNLRAEQAFGDRWSAFLRVENLANNQDGDRGNFDVSQGRTTIIGLRFTY